MDKETTKIHQVHNNFAKKIFSDPMHLLGLAKLCLPPYLADTLTLEQIELMPDTLIDNNLREYILDLMFKIKDVGDNMDRYVIVEFKSTQDILASPQVKTYAMNAMFKLARTLRQKGIKPQNSKKPLPMVYPVILYSGQLPFRYKLNYLDLIHGRKEDIDRYWRGKTCMIDLANMSDNVLSDPSYFPSNVPMLCLKHSRDDNMMDFLQNQPSSDKMAGQFQKYIQDTDEEMVNSLLHYIYDAGNIESEGVFANILNKTKPEMKEVMMTLRERAFNEGWEAAKGTTMRERAFNQGEQAGFNQGQQKAIRQSALKMLDMGESVKKITAIFGLSANEIMSLKNHAVDAEKV